MAETERTRTEWGVSYQRLDRDEWTQLLQAWPTLRDAKAHMIRLHGSPGLYRRVRIVRREVTAWRSA